MKINQQSGFTLIELIAVIVVLGILAATAIPRFVDLGADARRASLAAAAGSLRSLSAMAHGDFLVTVPAPATATYEGSVVTFVNGYPNAASVAAAAGLLATDYTLTVSAGASPTLTVSPVGVASAAACNVVYTPAAALGAPTIVSTTTNCL